MNERRAADPGARSVGVSSPGPSSVPGLSPLEIVLGYPLGYDAKVSLQPTESTPFTALVEVVREAVRRPPCCVAFSGGRDSSLVLAAAVRAARQEGMPLPLALTHRFPADEQANEDDWQELVLDHLGVEQQVFEGEDLELVGTIALAELRRRGVLFPPNLHLVAPLLGPATGGSLLVGVGGDEFLGDHRFEQLNNLLAGRRRPQWRDALRVGAAVLPAPLQGRLLARSGREPRPWIRPDALRQILALEACAAAEPVRFDRVVARYARARHLVVAQASLARIGADANVHVQAPLADSRFVAALARAGGARGWGSRAATMRAVAGDVLPDRILARRSKAIFNTVFFGEATLRFAEEWSGGGVDDSLVDPEELRRAWLELDQPFRTATLLQLAWLHDHAGAR